MIRINVKPDTAIWDKIIRDKDKLPGILTPLVRSNVPYIKNLMLPYLKANPGPVKYPIKWKTDKQRRAFFASNGFGNGIPTKRTGEIIAAWRVVNKSRGFKGFLQLVNAHPAVDFVQGEDQQPFHKNTGWVTAQETIDKFQPVIDRRVDEDWFFATRRYAGLS